MVFIIPIKRTSLSKSTRFSKFKDVIESEYFILQERKKHIDPDRNINKNDKHSRYKQSQSIQTPRNKDLNDDIHNDDTHTQTNNESKNVYNTSQSLNQTTPNVTYRSDLSQQQRDTSANTDKHKNIFSHRPNYRIITKGYSNNSYYELAYGSDINALKNNEWLYMTTELPQLMPPGLSAKPRLKWLLSHLTQKAIEMDESGILISSAIESGKQIDESDVDDDELQPIHGVPSSPTVNKSSKSPKLQPVNSQVHAVSERQRSPRELSSTSNTLKVNTTKPFIPISPRTENVPNSPTSPPPAARHSVRQSSAVSDDLDHDINANISQLQNTSPNRMNNIGQQKSVASSSELSLSRERADSIDSDVGTHTSEHYYNNDNTNVDSATETDGAHVPKSSHLTLSAGPSIPAATRHNRAITQASFAKTQQLNNNAIKQPNSRRARSYSQTNALQAITGKDTDDEQYIQDDSAIDSDDEAKYYRSNSTKRQSLSKLQQQRQLSNGQTYRGNTVNDINTVKRSDLYVLSGQTTWIITSILLCILFVLVRDASLHSFIIYMIVLLTSTYLLIQRGTPFRMSILLEHLPSKQSIGTLPLSSLPQYNGPAGVATKQSLTQRKSSNLTIHPPNSGIRATISDVTSPLSAPAVDQAAAISDIDDGVKYDSKGIKQDHITLAAPQHDDEPLSAPPVHDSPTVTRATHNNTISKQISTTQRMPIHAITNYDIHIPFSPGKRDPTRIPFGSTISHGKELGEHGVWFNADATTFSVRSSSYKRDKIKVPSAPALYDTIGMDVFASEKKLSNVCDLVELPLKLRRKNTETNQYEYKYGDEETDGWEIVYDTDVGVPELLVIQFQLPAYDPGYMSKKDDGDGFSTVFYYRLTDKGREEFRNNATPAVRAFKEFVQHCSSESYHNRFKAIPRVNNPDECSLNMALKRLLKTYSMKPFLTGPHCHGFIVRKGYMQVDIDVHKFCYMARKATYGFLGSLKTMIIDICFLVESQEEDDLPEQILGATEISYVDIKKFGTIEHQQQLLLQQHRAGK